jgi:hypothetical protein
LHIFSSQISLREIESLELSWTSGPSFDWDWTPKKMPFAYWSKKSATRNNSFRWDRLYDHEERLYFRDMFWMRSSPLYENIFRMELCQLGNGIMYHECVIRENLASFAPIGGESPESISLADPISSEMKIVINRSNPKIVDKAAHRHR